MTVVLQGIRVLDFTWVLAGPVTTSYLVAYGAEVIKVESTMRGDGRRAASLGTAMNSGKLSIGLSLATPEGQALAKDLVAVCDVVIDNYAPRTMPKFGLSYDEIAEVNPGAIVMRMPAMGLTGPRVSDLGYGPNLEGLSGIQLLSGVPGGPPVGTGQTLSDVLSPQHGFLALLAALLERERSGVGQLIDFSQLESGVSVLGPELLDYAVNHRLPELIGNRSLYAAPHGCFQCDGEDEWCVIAVETEDEWLAFGDALERPEWFSDPRFETLQLRMENADALELHVEEWTKRRTPEEVMLMLQAKGVPAGVVQSNGDIVERDPHLRAQGLVAIADAPGMDEGIPVARPSVYLSDGPPSYSGAAPEFGQHNDYVFGDILGLSRSEIDGYKDRAVIEELPPAPPDDATNAQPHPWWKKSYHTASQVMLADLDSSAKNDV